MSEAEKVIENKVNILAQPRLEKVVVNIGIGQYSSDKKAMERIEKELSIITGQRGVIRLAKKSIAGFKLREGNPVGYQITLRGQRMRDFLERLIRVALPRIRDFKGLSAKGFDEGGNYNLGIKEHIIFPEINYDEVDRIFGFNVTICTTAQSKEDALSLLKTLGFPFKEQ